MKTKFKYQIPSASEGEMDFLSGAPQKKTFSESIYLMENFLAVRPVRECFCFFFWGDKKS